MEIIVINFNDNRLIRTYMEDMFNVLNPKYFNQFHEIILTNTCFKKTHNKNYSLELIPIKKPDETHKIYNIETNVYRTALTKLSRFTAHSSMIIDAKHENGNMLMITRFTNKIVYYYAKMISQIFRYKYPHQNYYHIEELIQEFLY